MRNEVMWAIRDARGLSTGEVAILWAVESRGSSFTTIETLAGDAGMARTTFYGHRDGLLDRGLLRCRKRHGERQKVYTVDADAVRALIPPKRSDSERSPALAAHVG